MLVALAIVTGCDHSAADPATSGAITKPVEQAAIATAADTSSAPHEITFDMLKFEIGKGQPFNRKLLSPVIEGFFGKRIRIRGYIFAGSMLDNPATRFVLEQDSGTCCGPSYSPEIEDWIAVHMHPGDAARFSNKKIELEGILRFEEVRDTSNQQTVAIYRLDDAVVR